MNDANFRKSMENVRKHRDTKIVTAKERREYLVSETNYYATKVFPKYLLTIEVTIIDVLMNKPFCLALSIYEL